MTFLLGLTGNIGMGKSTTAKLFAEMGCAVWDADAAVHRTYANGGAAVDPLGAVFPDAIVDGAVSRDQLKRIIGENPDALKQIEAIVHPLMAQDRQKFLQNTKAKIVVFDNPLLFETGGQAHVNAVACVSIPPEIQRKRVLDRGTMTVDQFEFILSKQMPIAEKIARSDYVIVTDTLEHARQQVQDVIKDIQGKLAHA